jgi:hypothetical protein
MAKREQIDNDRTSREKLGEPGGKSDWERAASATPSDENEDPKDREPRKGDMSTREGDAGKNAPR